MNVWRYIQPSWRWPALWVLLILGIWWGFYAGGCQGSTSKKVRRVAYLCGSGGGFPQDDGPARIPL